MALTDFKLKYSGSILGYLWSLVKPLLFFGVLYVIFTYFFNVGRGIPNYPVYLLVGIVMWTFFAEATMGAMHAVVNRGDLIRKVNFPRIVIVLAAVITASLTFILNLVIVALFLWINKINPGFSVFVFGLTVGEFIIFVTGVGLILATLFTKFRDFAHIWEVSLQILFYAVPILYPISLIPNGLGKLIMINPLAQILQDARWALVSPNVVTSWKMLGLPVAFAVPALVLFILVFGIWFFQVSAKNFAEEV